MESENWNFSPGGAPKQVRPAGEAASAPPPPQPPPSTPAPAPQVPQVPQVHQVVYPQPAPIQQTSNGMATASLVLGILGLFLPILSILALIFGGIGISKANQG